MRIDLVRLDDRAPKSFGDGGRARKCFRRSPSVAQTPAPRGLKHAKGKPGDSVLFASRSEGYQKDAVRGSPCMMKEFCRGDGIGSRGDDAVCLAEVCGRATGDRRGDVSPCAAVRGHRHLGRGFADIGRGDGRISGIQTRQCQWTMVRKVARQQFERACGMTIVP